MPACNNTGIVTIRNTTRTAFAMERSGKHVSAQTNSMNNRTAVFSVRSVREIIKRTKKPFKSVKFGDASLPVYETGNRNETVSGDGSRKIKKRWQESNQTVKRRLHVCYRDSQTVINPLPEYY
jgi:hypothetical protein